MRCPDSICEYVRPLMPSDRGLLSTDNRLDAFQIRCTCGGELFHVFNHPAPKVRIHCALCRRRIMLYEPNLSAVSKDDAESWAKYLNAHNEDKFYVMILFEYPADAMDDNNFCWCQIYGRSWLYKKVDLIMEHKICDKNC